jgi:hypothetical protein
MPVLSSLQRHPTALTRGAESVQLIGWFSSAPCARTKGCTVGINHERIYREVKPLFAYKLAEDLCNILRYEVTNEFLLLGPLTMGPINCLSNLSPHRHRAAAAETPCRSWTLL